METFLKQAARQILAEHPKDTDNVLVVFNNRRSALFMRHAFEAISAESDTAFFLPKMTTIDDMIADLGGLKIVQPEFLLFELYRIHGQIGGEERKYRTFEDFIAFGEMMISDFSEIDRYCVDARDLFVNLHNLKKIGEWDVEHPSNNMQSDYLAFYHRLYDYYTSLRNSLKARGEAYGGMAYREVAENIERLASKYSYGDIYFIGFNALSECERRIMLEFERRHIGHLLTDGDVYYYADERQEAGHFLRKHSKEFSELGHFGPSLFGQGRKRITVVECPENVLQCKFAGHLLDQHHDWLHDPESTAVVLADEKLMIPMLNSLPDAESDYGVNVSMGYNYADSSVHGLVCAMLRLYRQANDKGYYHADVTELLGNYLVSMLHDGKSLRQEAVKHLSTNNMVRCRRADLAGIVPDGTVGDLLPDAPPTPDGVLAMIRTMAGRLAACEAMESNRKEKQALGGLVEILDYLERMQAEYHYITDNATLEKIYLRIARRHMIAFLGQPLSGLQMLGMLETRNLDFRRIILLSANEGLLPSGRSDGSLIPFELRHAFGLPTYEEKESIFAYHFYRLLQRAEEVWLVYSSEPEAMGKGEESRYIKQVRSELARRFGNIELSSLVVSMDMRLHGDAVPAEGVKNEAVMRRLAELAQKGLSPSALNVYLGCPLDYYYQYVLGVREHDDLDDDLDASQLGTVVHKVLQGVYEPFKGRRLEQKAVEDALDNLTDLVRQGFDKFLSHGRNADGRNSFLASVAESQIGHMLRNELRHLKAGDVIEVVALEGELSHTVSVGGQKVRLAGTVDRIDRFTDHATGRRQLRVIDYKTGSLKDSDISLATFDPDGGKAVPGKWLQLMFYAMLYRRTFGRDEPLVAGIYPLRNLHSDVRLATCQGSQTIDATMLDDFERYVCGIVASILDSSQPFVPPEKPSLCRFCPAVGFCKFFSVCAK